MKKIFKIFLGLGISLSLMSCGKEALKNDLSKENLKGKIKSIETRNFNFIKNNPLQTTALKRTEIRNYNEKGFIIDSKVSGDYNYATYYIYNSKNQLILSNYYQDGATTPYSITEYIYDSNGNQTEEIKSGNKEWSHSYDQKGNKISSSNFTKKGILWTNYDYEYDKNRNIIKETSTNDFLKNKSIKENIYDKDNRLIEMLTSITPGLINDLVNFHEDVNTKEEYSYDSKGNLIKITSSNSFKTFEYKYDSKGNWIEKIEFIDENPIKFQERTYIYH